MIDGYDRSSSSIWLLFLFLVDRYGGLSSGVSGVLDSAEGLVGGLTDRVDTVDDVRVLLDGSAAAFEA